MARYNTFQYGTSETYGASAVTEGGDVTWILQFDWDNNGSFDGTNEAGKLKNCSIKRGRLNYLSEQGGGFEHMRPGKAVLTLDNKDRRYDPRNDGSALYPNVLPGRAMILQVVDNSGPTTYTVFTGIIDDIRPFNEPGGGVVQIECMDYLADFYDQVLSDGTVTRNKDVRDVIRRMFTTTEARQYGRNLDADEQPIIVFSVKDQNAGAVMGEITDASLGHFFYTADGRARYYSRSHNYGSATGINQSVCLNDPIVSQPWEDVYNHVTVYANRPMRQQPAVIFFLPGPLTMAQSTDVELELDYTPAWDRQIGTFEANTAQDGTGTDITDTTTAAPDLQVNGGTVTFRNNSNAGYITKLEIRGRIFGVVEQKYVRQDTTSQDTYGLRRFILDSQFLQDPKFAKSFAVTIKNWLKDDRENIELQIQGREDIQYGYDLMEKVNFVSGTLDIDDDYWVMGIDHDWNKNTGQDVTTTLYLSKIITDDTSITAAPVLEEMEQAPLSYESPPGDPETIEPILSNPEAPATSAYGGRGALLRFTSSSLHIAKGGGIVDIDYNQNFGGAEVAFDTNQHFTTFYGNRLKFTATGRWMMGIGGYWQMGSIPWSPVDKIRRMELQVRHYSGVGGLIYTYRTGEKHSHYDASDDEAIFVNPQFTVALDVNIFDYVEQIGVVYGGGTGSSWEATSSSGYFWILKV